MLSNETEALLKALIVRLNQYLTISTSLQDEGMLNESKEILEELNAILNH